MKNAAMYFYTVASYILAGVLQVPANVLFRLLWVKLERIKVTNEEEGAMKQGRYSVELVI